MTQHMHACAHLVQMLALCSVAACLGAVAAAAAAALPVRKHTRIITIDVHMHCLQARTQVKKSPHLLLHLRLSATATTLFQQPAIVDLRANVIGYVQVLCAHNTHTGSGAMRSPATASPDQCFCRSLYACARGGRDHTRTRGAHAAVSPEQHHDTQRTVRPTPTPHAITHTHTRARARAARTAVHSSKKLQYTFLSRPFNISRLLTCTHQHTRTQKCQTVSPRLTTHNTSTDTYQLVFYFAHLRLPLRPLQL
jgi:hypothetical protein